MIQFFLKKINVVASPGKKESGPEPEKALDDLVIERQTSQLTCANPDNSLGFLLLWPQ